MRAGSSAVADWPKIAKFKCDYNVTADVMLCCNYQFGAFEDRFAMPQGKNKFKVGILMKQTIIIIILII